MISIQKFTKTNTRFETSSRTTRRSRRCVTPRVGAMIAGIVSRTVSISLVISLLAGSTPGAPRTVVAVANDWSVSFGFWLRANGWPNKLVGRQVKDQEKQEDRDAKVSTIRIYPGDVVVDVNERVQFAASAYDSQDDPTGGVKIKWRIQHRGQNRGARISPRGEFEAHFPGSYEVTAEGAGKKAQVTVTVNDVPVRRRDDAAPIRSRQVSSRDLPTQAQLRRGPGIKATPSDGLVARESKVSTRKGRKKLAHAAAPLLPGDGWNDSNYWSADDPGNSVGDPPGGAIDNGAGSGNFQIAAPVLGLPGRGIDLSLGLAYNSRLWNKADTQISFDNDRGWPSPGWSLGFGQLLALGVYRGAMLVDADGTRHGYTGTITEYPWGTTFVGHTTDGTFIDYEYTTGTGGIMLSAQARFANGTVIDYGATGPGGLHPVSIQDPNGNYINITYVNNAGPRIQTITDTLNRTITFHYDSSNRLTAITGPGLNNTVRTLVRLHYRQIALDYSFSGLTPSVRDGNPWVLNAIYYPGTNTGYWFGESNSYSTYGMIAKVSERRNMSLSAGSLNEQGTITSAGDVTREEVYSYPLTTGDTGGSGLTDAPTYSSMTERWSRDGTNIDQAVTSYSSQPNASPRTVTVTLPNGTKNVQYLHNIPGDFKDGLVYHDQTLDAGNNVLQSSFVTWQQGAYESPRPVRVEATNEGQQTTATEFSYGSVYNQVTEVRNYDYGGTTLIRATRTQYQNSTNYTSRHIFNLPSVVEIYAGDGVTRVSRTDYQYDGQTLTDTPDVVMHHDSHNPYAPAYLVSPGTCCEYDHFYVNCITYCPDYWANDYNPATDYRGNVTQVTTYGDAVNLTGAVTETRRYDITGNVVTTSSACCEQTSFNYTNATQFAHPSSQTRGSATDQLNQITTGATYDFNTGAVLSSTDANGRVSQTFYLADTLRPERIVLPTGAHTDLSYDDAAMKVTQTTYLESHPTHTTIANKNEKLLNGRGQVRRELALGVSSVWDIVDIEYDPMGRVIKQSQPYRTGTPQWTHVVYDALGRTRKVIAPDYTLPDASDGSTTETFYNEVARPSVASALPGETTRVRDAWGRERWGRTDAQGRLVEVVEPNPSGNGSVFVAGALLTSYTYDTMGNVTQTSQNASQTIQTRSFKYDSLGRLTAQKLAETDATLNDAGAYQSSGGGTWGDVFTYDDRSNLISRTDARGVKTIYTYSSDPLNRLQSVSWDTSGFGDTGNPILPAASVSYQYRSKSSGSQLLDITQLSSITTTGVSTEGYSYDTEGRVSTKTLTLTSRASYPFVTDYIYDDLDRIEDVRYPAEYGNGSQPRKLVHHSYDVASRLTSLTVGGATHASQIVYNADSQTTSLSVGASGPNQILETYNYEQHTGLLANQTIARSSTPTNYLLDLSYDYAGLNGKQTGQLVKLLNNKNHNKDRSYNYDALGRLVQAKGGPSASPLWTQTYTYDNFGNRTSVSASGHSARNQHSSPTTKEGLAQTTHAPSADVSVGSPTHSLAAQNEDGSPETNSLSVLHARKPRPNSHHVSRTARNITPDPQVGPPVFTDPDLLAPGGVQIKTLHITELRTAINDVRIRLGFAAFSWQTSATSGGLIKADPIIELRTALDQAIGPPASPGYSAGLGPSQPILAIHIQELRNRVVAAWNSSSQIPRDGHESLSYDLMNRITTSGFAYDKAGNQVRALKAGGGIQRFQYDAANRLVKVKADDPQTVIATYTYGDSNERLILEEGGLRTYFTCDGNVEYTESGSGTTPAWSKSYVHLGSRLLSTLTPNGSGGEFIEYHHPDSLGTRLVSNAQDTTSFEQVALPFGTALNSESTGSTNQRFTSYDRSGTTGIDYAINRHYDSQQGRFTQVDPIGMSATNLADPQSLNLYAYCGNDPINHIDPEGLFFGKLFKWIGKVLKWIGIVALVVMTIIWLAPASSFIFEAALWMFSNILLPLSQVPILGTFVPLGSLGSPQWNPQSRGVFGNSWQDPDDVVRVAVNCKNNWPVPDGPNCPGAPWYKKAFQAVKHVAGLIWRGYKQVASFYSGQIDQIAPINKYLRRGGQWLIGVQVVDENSGAYSAGGWFGLAEQTAASVFAAASGPVQALGKTIGHNAYVRIGKWYTFKGSTVKQWRIAFGGRKRFIHGHIHKDNWYKPWKWIQKWGTWKKYN